ncbi:hypothetical protein EPH95_02785 [Salicibibacter halophilus]|uniref:Uncharacterized protein n=1 Tax=Salicibibacter halophilus TaxID=2502791 RepID=A0A514LEH4_9BACI|nr:hypothetical protein [Salicibibacter halophilus]QDI90229.1 hypothetical protein EPH95_02785 [Salicibibacter halophilus]
MSEEKINFRQIDVNEAMQLVLNKETHKLYFMNRVTLVDSREYRFELEDLRHKKWFKKEVVN